MSVRLLLSLLAMVVLVAAGTAFAEPDVSIAQQRLARFGKGVNATRWFWGEGLASDERMKAGFSDAELQSIRRLGAGHVRLCVDPKMLTPTQGTIAKDRAELVVAVAKRLHAQGLGCIVDIHGWDTEALEKPEGPAALVAFWTQLAPTLATTDPESTMLEIMNEPIYRDRAADWAKVQAELIRTIRAAAPKHTIVAAGNSWSSIDGLVALTPDADRNVVYTFHFYEPHLFSHQSATWSWKPLAALKGVEYPTNRRNAEALMANMQDKDLRWALNKDCIEAPWDRARIAARIGEAAAWGRKHGVPVHCGEFGIYPPAAPPTDRINWLRDVVATLDREGIPWTVWGWDDGFGLGRRYENGEVRYDRAAAAAIGFDVVKEINGEARAKP